MTEKEANELGRIFASVDSHCSTCIERVCRKANNARLGWHWVFDEKVKLIEVREGNAEIVEDCL
jgi:hypothetical protein